MIWFALSWVDFLCPQSVEPLCSVKYALDLNIVIILQDDFSVKKQGIKSEKKSECSFVGVKPMKSPVLAFMLYHYEL